MQTVVLKLKVRTPNRGKHDRLIGLQSEFTGCVRFHLGRALALKTTDATALHRDCYREARERFPGLPASTLQQARDKAISAYRGYLEKKKRDRRANPPTFRRPLPIRVAVENLKVVPDEGMVRVSTTGGFLWLPILIPPCFAATARQPHAVSEIVRKGKDWFLMLAVKHEDVPVQGDERPHFGLDLGLAHVAVLSGPKVVKFFRGGPLKGVRDRRFRTRQALQRKRKTGMIMRSKGKESRWAANMNHEISRTVVNIVAAAGGVLHVEDLAGIRDRCKGSKGFRRALHSWPFAQLLEFIRYKARLAGVEVITEDPRYTSQRCSRCGHTERANRPRQATFRCRACDFQLHPDLNAARNLSARRACSAGECAVTAHLSGEAGGTSAAVPGPRDNRDLASST